MRQARPTTVAGSTQLSMMLTAADLAAGGNVSVTVANPPPGGGVSPPATFRVAPMVPVITGVTPDFVVIDVPQTPVTISGSGFTPATIVWLSGVELTPTSVTPNSIAVTLTGFTFTPY